MKGMLDAVLEGMPDGLCVTDAGGVILDLNPQAARLLEIAPRTARGRSLCGLLCAKLACGSKDCASGCPLRQPGGPREITFEGRFGPVKTYGWAGDRVRAVDSYRPLRVHCVRTTDSSDEARHVAFIEDATADLEREQLREDWRNMVAHDLRSPLANVFATLRLQQEAARGACEAPGPDLLDASLRSCSRVLNLLDVFLDLGALERGMRPKLQAVELAPLLEDAFSEKALAAQEKGLFLELDPGDGGRVWADPELLLRVTINLLDNAIKYSPPLGKISISASGAPTVRIVVRDQGPGIPSDELPRIFERYYRGKTSGPVRKSGAGLGLAFCSEAVAAMGGRISAFSREGRGAEFVVELPARAPAPPAGEER